MGSHHPFMLRLEARSLPHALDERQQNQTRDDELDNI
jgi:hypothetical protein